MITLITTIAVLGLLLVAVLASMIFDGASRRQYRSRARSVADLLNYASMIDDGIILQKDGALMAAWEYTAADHESSTSSDLEAARELLNRALSTLSNGWVFHIDAVRHPSLKYPPSSSSDFPDPITRAIDEERRRLFEKKETMYEGRFVITATYYAPLLTQQKVTEMLFDDDYKPNSSKERHEAVINDFKRQLETIEHRLTMVLKVSRLKGREEVQEDGSVIVRDDFLSWIQSCISGEERVVNLPKTPIYLDGLLGGDELHSGIVPVLGRKYIQVVAIEGLPTESSPGLLNWLSELPIQVRWSTRFIFLDQHEAESLMDKYRKKWRQKVRGIISVIMYPNGGGPVDKDAASMEEDAEDALGDIRGGRGASGYYTSVVVLMDEDREKVETNARKVEKGVNMLGFVARIETINTMAAYFGSLPGHSVENVTRPLLDTLNLVDLIPSSSIWTGDEECPCPYYPPHSPALMVCEAKGSTPFRLNLHTGDVGHTLIFGPTGSGKSVAIATLLAQARRYRDMNIYAFDKGNSLFPLASCINAYDKNAGTHYDIGGDNSKLAFCPLQYLEDDSDIAWAAEWIETLVTLSANEPVTPNERNLIHTALKTTAQGSGRTLSVFSNALQNTRLKEALKPYTRAGAMGRLLDADRDGLSFSTFTVFEIEELMNLGDKYLIPILLYIFRRIEKSLDGSPSIICIDEAWIALGHPRFREKIREWLKVLRKLNCSVIMATQSISDAAKSGIVDVLVESTATQIFLPNPKAQDEHSRSLYEDLGLNSAQINIIARAIPKREYYAVSEKGRRLFNLSLGKLALAFVGVSDKASLSDMKELIQRYSPDDRQPTPEFVQAWLSRRNLNLNNYVTK